MQVTLHEIIAELERNIEAAGDHHRIYRRARVSFWLDVACLLAFGLVFWHAICQVVDLSLADSSLLYCGLSMVLVWPLYLRDTSAQSPEECKRKLMSDVLGDLLVTAHYGNGINVVGMEPNVTTPKG